MKTKTLLTPLFALLTSPAIAQQDPEVLAGSPLNDLLAATVRVDQATLQRLDVLVEPGRSATVRIELDGAVHTLVLAPVTLRSGDCQVLVDTGAGALVPAELPAEATYRGYVEGDAGSAVAASVVDGTVDAIIHLSNGARFGVQPARSLLPNVLDDFHVVYDEIDVRSDGSTCGSGDAERVGFIPLPGDGNGNDGAGGPAQGSAGRSDIAFDADFEFFQANGSSITNTILDIENVMNQVGLVYQSGGLPTTMCYRHTGYIVRSSSSDPYTATESGALLNEFKAAWTSVGFQRGLAHLFTGRDLDGTIIGIAWIGTVCDVNWHYGLSQSLFSTNMINRTQLTAHEIGHNWSCCHCNEGGCTGGGADADCGIMNSFVNGALNWSVRSRNQIESYRNQASCLDTCWNPVWVDSFAFGFQDGSFINPFDTVLEGVNGAMVTGQVNIIAGSYDETFSTNRKVTLTASGGTVTIGQ